MPCAPVQVLAAWFGASPASQSCIPASLHPCILTAAKLCQGTIPGSLDPAALFPLLPRDLTLFPLIHPGPAHRGDVYKDPPGEETSAQPPGGLGTVCSRRGGSEILNISIYLFISIYLAMTVPAPSLH